MVRRVANISCVMVGWVSPLVFVADSVPARWSSGVYTPAFKCGHKCFFVNVCVCMHVPAYGSVQYDELYVRDHERHAVRPHYFNKSLQLVAALEHG